MVRILLVDDNPDDRLLAIRQLSQAFPDAQVQEIAEINGLNQALEADNFDLVVTDYQLRWSDGIKVLQAVKARYPDRPVVMFTNTGNEEVAVEAMKAGLSDYVIKSPKYIHRLSAAVQLALQRSETDRRLARLESRLRALVEMSRALAEAMLDLPAVLDLVSRRVVALLGDVCVIRLVSEDGQLLTPVGIFHPKPEAMAFLQELLTAEPQRVDEGLTGRVFQTGQPLLIPEVSLEKMSELSKPEYRPYIEHFGMYSLLIAPLQVRGRRIGTLLVSRDRPGFPYTADDQVFLENLAERAALAVDNARIYRESQQANRLKDEFLTNLSHELRSPLNSILGWASLLKGQTLDVATTTKALETIERNAKSQKQLIEEILDVSQMIRGKLALDVHPIDLFPVIQAALDVVRPAAEAKEIQLQSVLSSTADLVLGDAERLQQVFWNLLSNAVKFTPRGGYVEVRLERVNAYVQLQVRDTGVGISADFLPYVFDRFRQADSTTTKTYGGLGLGLAIARQLVELHGGSIEVESLGLGQGTTFIVQLPVLDNSGTEEQRSRGVAGESSGLREQGRIASSKSDQTPNRILSSLQVLIVDDEPDTRELLQFILEDYGAAVIAVESVSQALKQLANVYPDVLVSDIGMPQQDGYVLIRQLRTLEANTGRQIPALALTAYVGLEEQARTLSAGFQKYLSKPVEPSQLVAAVAELAGRSNI